MKSLLLILLVCAQAPGQIRSWATHQETLRVGDAHILLECYLLDASRAENGFWGETDVDGHAVRRVIRDSGGRAHFGYKLSVDSRPDGSYTFRVSAIPGIPSFPAPPAPVRVPDGGRVQLTLLERENDSGTLADAYVISRYESRLQASHPWGTDEPRDLTLSAIKLRLKNYRLFRGPEVLMDRETGGAYSAGDEVVVKIPGRGEVLLSIVPVDHLANQKLGRLDRRRLFFTLAGEEYEILCAESIIGQDGVFNIYGLANAETSALEPRLYTGTGLYRDFLHPR